LEVRTLAEFSNILDALAWFYSRNLEMTRGEVVVQMILFLQEFDRETVQETNRETLEAVLQIIWCGCCVKLIHIFPPELFEFLPELLGIFPTIDSCIIRIGAEVARSFLSQDPHGVILRFLCALLSMHGGPEEATDFSEILLLLAQSDADLFENEALVRKFHHLMRLSNVKSRAILFSVIAIIPNPQHVFEGLMNDPVLRLIWSSVVEQGELTAPALRVIAHLIDLSPEISHKWFCDPDHPVLSIVYEHIHSSEFDQSSSAVLCLLAFVRQLPVIFEDEINSAGFYTGDFPPLLVSLATVLDFDQENIILDALTALIVVIGWFQARSWIGVIQHFFEAFGLSEKLTELVSSEDERIAELAVEIGQLTNE
jgi:hypothetical protein